MKCGLFQNWGGKHQQGGQYQKNNGHADQRAAADLSAQTADEFHTGDQGDAEGGGEKGQSAGQNALAALLHRGLGGFLCSAAQVHFLTESGGHQDGVIYRSAKLDGTDNNAGYEGQHPRR